MSIPASAYAVLFLFSTAGVADWTQFRGPNASGIATTKGLPQKFGPSENVIWKTPLPPGHSSPVLTADRIFLTALEEEKLFVFCLDRATGRILWRREAPRVRKQELHKMNHPASPSAVTDGGNVYVFFTDFGLISYGPDGNERWRLPLGPFNNPFGMGASPVLAEGKLIQICDSESGSFMVAVDPKDGRVVWRKERPDFTRGFSTPVLYKPASGGLQALVAGSGALVAYAVADGSEVWHVGKLTWQLKPTPVLGRGTIYISNWAGGADTGQQENVQPFEQATKSWDANHDSKLSPEELPDPRLKKQFKDLDLDNDGFLGARDWERYRAKRSSQNAVLAFKLGGKGDMTDQNFLWAYTKSLPNVPSPLLYENVLYLMKEGGIFTALNPADGSVLKQGRLQGALDQYFASPVAADGKIFTISQEGAVSVIRPGPDWEVLAVNSMDDEVFATPAFDDTRMYLRTRSALYCFGAK